MNEYKDRFLIAGDNLMLKCAECGEELDSYPVLTAIPISQIIGDAYSDHIHQIPDPPTPLASDELKSLAIYNAERARGVVHTTQFDRDMHQIQVRFDAIKEWRRNYGE